MKLTGRWQRLAAWLIAGYIRLLARTGRWRVEGDAPVQALLASGERIILAFWHGRLLMIPEAYRRLGGEQVHVLISEHRDGELIAQTIAHFGYRTVRGSTRRGAVKGLLGMLRIARGGGDLAITPDGPRGPREQLQMGVIEIARVTGLPIVPITFSARWAKRMSSWDGFMLPFPGSAGVMIWGQPLRVPAELDAATREALRQQLEADMLATRQRADTQCGH